MTSADLREKRAGVILEARHAFTDAEKREGGATAEDRAALDKALDAADELLDKAKRLERVESAEASLDAPLARSAAPIVAENRGRVRTVAEYRGTDAYAEVYLEFLRTGQIRFEKIPAEYRDTILGTDAKGGYLSTPTKLADEVVKQCDNMVFVRQLAKIVKLTEAKSLGIPQLSTRMGAANWTTEVQAVTEDTTQALGRRDLTPVQLSKLAKVSIRMLYAATGIESFIADELSYQFAVTEENAYLNGTGSAQPLGVFTGSASGVPTSRDVSTGNTTTAIVADNLFSVKYSLKAPYLADPSCRWVFHRDAIKNISVLRGTDGANYLWQPGLQAGQPDRLLGVPVAISEYAPNTFTTGLYVGLIGAFRYYWIAETNDLQIQRLVELYAATGEVGFIGRKFIDASPVLGEAFARVKLG